MIRQALFALGLSAGAAHAQGLVPTAPILEACGGTRLVLEAKGDADSDALENASEVVNRRLGGLFSDLFDYTTVQDNQIIVSVPPAFGTSMDAITPLFDRIDFAFHEVQGMAGADGTPVLAHGEVVLPDAGDPARQYVLKTVPLLDGLAVQEAAAGFDQNNRPAVTFRFSPAAGEVFGEYTTANIGQPFAIVARGEVLSAPVIQSPIWGGSGLITGSFTEAEVLQLAAMLHGGVLPFGLDVVFEETMDGSDPSAAFCP